MAAGIGLHLPDGQSHGYDVSSPSEEEGMSLEKGYRLLV
jgi:hypothetical protein